MKTEYEKMIAGEFYSPMDPELRRLAQEARTKQFAFNQEADGEKKEEQESGRILMKPTETQAAESEAVKEPETQTTEIQPQETVEEEKSE